MGLQKLQYLTATKYFWVINKYNFGKNKFGIQIYNLNIELKKSQVGGLLVDLEVKKNANNASLKCTPRKM
jgi:hypothetical protein